MECIGDRGTEIQEFYRGANVLVTGATGFMGKVLVEKLLRSCPHLSNIYLLVRSKKGKNSESRLDEIFDDPVRRHNHSFSFVYICKLSLFVISTHQLQHSIQSFCLQFFEKLNFLL
jgi:FlaA1/EpsC-like NDP-sugar epimerase